MDFPSETQSKERVGFMARRGENIYKRKLSIGKNAFNVDSESGWSTPYGDYTGISTVNYGGSAEQWNNIKIISGNDKLQQAKKFNYNSNVSYSGSCGKNATWKITNKTLEILGSGAIENYFCRGYGKGTEGGFSGA